MYSFKLPTDFRDKNVNSIFKTLVKKNETEFQVIYEKTFLYDKDCYSSENIGIDHMLATYAGQRLSEVVENFTYHVPPYNTKEPYRFEFTTTNMELLAETIAYIGYTDEEYEHEIDGDSWNHFVQDAIKWAASPHGSMDDIACYGLWHISNYPPQV